MPLTAQNPLLNLEVRSVHFIDTENTLNLHGLWSIFSKCADTLQEGKRLENLSWRIYSRETFCCTPTHHTRLPSFRRNSSNPSVSDLSTSFNSKSSVDSDMESSTKDLESRIGTLSISESGRKHITPIDLENIVKSVTESKELEPLSPLPRSLCPAEQHTSNPSPQPLSHQSKPNVEDTSKFQALEERKLNPESSTSTMATAGSQGSQLSNFMGESTSTELSVTSIVRGFSKENISRSRMSRTQLAAPQPILKPSPKTASPLSAPMIANTLGPKRKPAAFMLGGSEGDDSSPESLASRGFLNREHSSSRKTTSFKDEVQLIHDRFSRTDEAIDDSDDEPSESAIEDDDDWEDEPESSAHVDSGDLFKRVDSSTNLSSRRSLITTMMHEKDRAAAIQNAASRSTPAIRRRTSSHNGPMGSSSSKENISLSRARPINTPDNANTSEGSQLPPSPRTNRRNMLSTELTGSLRKHLLWERQNRNPPAKALKNRSYRSEIKLSDHTKGPYLGPSDNSLRRNESLNFYDNGVQEYFEKGW